MLFRSDVRRERFVCRPSRRLERREDDIGLHRHAPEGLVADRRRECIQHGAAARAHRRFADAARALIEEHRRFATGIYLFWYPAKSMASVAAAAGEMMNAGMTSLLKVELDVGAPPEPVAEGRGPKLSATGLLIVNPPYGFADEMKSLLPYLARHLSQGPNAACTVAWLAGGE